MQFEHLGPYRIGRKLGKGGMGSVYEAVDEKSGQRVAVKALSPQLAAADGFRERFEAEIESLKKLQHDGIVRLYGYGEHDGVLFYSMELVDGASLEQEINAGRRFDWQETLTLAIQICRALKHAHDHGVVHRDVKPANLLLTLDDRVKIADFGIARLFGATQLTNAGGVLGTADYMSPEQADGRGVTEKTDQYALGCVMFALLAGRPPFRAKTMPEMLQMQRFAEPEPVRRFAPETPEQLDRLIRQLLSKEPAERFPNVLVLARHMEAMQKALSRPAKTDAAGDTLPEASIRSPVGSTSVFDADATLAPEDQQFTPLETTDSGVYDAPTLAEKVEWSLAEGAAPVAAQPLAGAATVRPTTAVLPRGSRFTTVDEDALQQSRPAPGHRLVVGLQLAGLAAALGALAWLGWRLTRPASADTLYAAIAEVAEEDGGEDLRPASDEIADFLNRYASDPRAAEVQAYADELELQQRERQLRNRAKFSGSGEAHPIAEVFAEAMALGESDPARAAAMLDSLLTLYPATGGDAVKVGEEEQTYLTLATRELSDLKKQLARRAAEQLPMLKERLVAARRLEASEPERAIAMYRALVNLYGNQPWAAEIVAAARNRLNLAGREE